MLGLHVDEMDVQFVNLRRELREEFSLPSTLRQS